MAEYALILSLIAILLITSVAFFGENLDGLFTRIGDTLPF
jgi:Flp pilus assembly pilin Flp